MKKTWILYLLLLYHFQSYSQTIVSSICNGNWNDPAVWSTGNVPASNNIVKVYHNINLNVSVSLILPGYLYIDSSGSVCGNGNFVGQFITYGPFMLGTLTIQGNSSNYNYLGTSGNIAVNGNWAVNGLACAGCGSMCLPSMSCHPTPCYTLNSPVHDTLAATFVHDWSGCDPVYSYEATVQPGTFPYASGVTLALLVYSVNAPSGSVSSIPGGTVNVGDTLPLPTTNPAGGYQFIFSQGGFITLYLIAYGTPTIANQNYASHWNYIYRSYDGCQDTLIFMHNMNCTVNSALGMNELKTGNFSVYPNPSSGEFNINISEDNFSTTIFDILGNTVYQNKSEKKLDLSGLDKGIYYILVQCREKIYKQKIIID